MYLPGAQLRGVRDAHRHAQRRRRGEDGLPVRTEPTNPLALHVDDVAEARATLEARGVEFAGDTLDTGVCHMAFFADPDGNALMLHHRYAKRVPTG